jgi:hypothetical protein
VRQRPSLTIFRTSPHPAQRAPSWSLIQTFIPLISAF